MNTLKKDGNKYSFSLTLFDTVIVRLATNKPIDEIKNLDKESYKPGGMTALYDAVCQTIDDVKNTTTPDQKVLTVIMTDGEENSSKEYSQEQLKAKIKELEKGNWSFVFLGANQDSWANAAKFGIPTMNAANFVATSAGVAKTMSTLASNTTMFASAGDGATSKFFSTTDQSHLMKDETA